MVLVPTLLGKSDFYSSFSEETSFGFHSYSAHSEIALAWITDFSYMPNMSKTSKTNSKPFTNSMAETRWNNTMEKFQL